MKRLKSLHPSWLVTLFPLKKILGLDLGISLFLFLVVLNGFMLKFQLEVLLLYLLFRTELMNELTILLGFLVFRKATGLNLLLLLGLVDFLVRFINSFVV